MTHDQPDHFFFTDAPKWKIKPWREIAPGVHWRDWGMGQGPGMIAGIASGDIDPGWWQCDSVQHNIATWYETREDADAAIGLLGGGDG